MDTVYIGLGGNVGPTLQLLEQAVAALRFLGAVQMSRIYRTRPLCDQPQSDYLNAVVSLETQLAPLDLLAAMQTIEWQLGKRPKSKDAPRPIDLDLIYYKSLSIETESLTVPHPRWRERLFVIRPLRDLTDRLLIDNQWVMLDSIIKSFPAEQKDWVVLL
jgi:2-amino-4-hydroxy-6-hydroxymethyldihydropteridine diphosphokinase